MHFCYLPPTWEGCYLPTLSDDSVGPSDLGPRAIAEMRYAKKEKRKKPKRHKRQDMSKHAQTVLAAASQSPIPLQPGQHAAGDKKKPPGKEDGHIQKGRRERERGLG
ncbi:hypothetical protein PMIN06_010688 [Paraphaeosphaeria minitans]